jgi:hypothetical protein
MGVERGCAAGSAGPETGPNLMGVRRAHFVFRYFKKTSYAQSGSNPASRLRI